MPVLPTGNLRQNIETWVVPVCHYPAVAYILPHLAPTEQFDPTFQGQKLETTYFDTRDFDLRKARLKGKKYCTLRVRCYEGGRSLLEGKEEVYALSVKTESEKWRTEIDPERADMLLGGRWPADILGELPGNFLARLTELVDDHPLVPVVTVCAHRYAVESDMDRLTFDVDVTADNGKCLPYGVLEFKSQDRDTQPSGSLLALNLRPLKISKFLYFTGTHHG